VQILLIGNLPIMAKSNNLLFFGALGVAAWYLLTRYNTISSLNFIPRGLGLVGNAVSVIIGVQNPTSQGIQLQSISGNLILNGSSVGNVADFTPVLIAPNAETQINLLITPNIFGIAANAIYQLQNGLTGGINATLQGTANVNNNPIPLNVNFIQ
jgi:hypothetical protein